MLAYSLLGYLRFLTTLVGTHDELRMSWWMNFRNVADVGAGDSVDTAASRSKIFRIEPKSIFGQFSISSGPFQFWFRFRLGSPVSVTTPEFFDYEKHE